MSTAIEAIIAQVNKLPPSERVELVDRLVAEVNPDEGLEEIEASWLEEVARRRADVLSGREKTIPLEEVQREIREQYGFKS